MTRSPSPNTLIHACDASPGRSGQIRDLAEAGLPEERGKAPGPSRRRFHCPEAHPELAANGRIGGGRRR